jgi:hypothetical protein
MKTFVTISLANFLPSLSIACYFLNAVLSACVFPSCFTPNL